MSASMPEIGVKLTDLEAAIALQLDTEATHGLIAYYHDHMQNPDAIEGRLSRHLKNETRRRTRQGELLSSEIITYALHAVNWRAIAASLICTD